MFKNGKILTITASLFILIILLIYHYIFNIYETTIETVPENLFACSRSAVNISINPINALGFKIPFRKISGSFKIIEGRDLVEIVKEDDKEGRLSLRAKCRTGKIVIYVKSKFSFLPSLVEINIISNAA
jgi:hypothetical protein